MKHILIIILTAFLFTGCGVYKRYSRPEMNTSGLYGSAETADTTTIASLSWKELFADPLLQSLIEEGLQNNTDLNSPAPGRRSRSIIVCRKAGLSPFAIVGATGKYKQFRRQ